GSFLRLKCLDRTDKIGIARALLAIRRERTRRKDLDRISMLDWLLQKRQTPHAIDRFWRQILVSAVNEDLERMAAIHGFQVFWLGFMARADSRDPVGTALFHGRRAPAGQRPDALSRAGGTHRRRGIRGRRGTPKGRLLR